MNDATSRDIGQEKNDIQKDFEDKSGAAHESMKTSHIESTVEDQDKKETDALKFENYEKIKSKNTSVSKSIDSITKSPSNTTPAFPEAKRKSSRETSDSPTDISKSQTEISKNKKNTKKSNRELYSVSSETQNRNPSAKTSEPKMVASREAYTTSESRTEVLKNSESGSKSVRELKSDSSKTENNDQFARGKSVFEEELLDEMLESEKIHHEKNRNLNEEENGSRPSTPEPNISRAPNPSGMPRDKVHESDNEEEEAMINKAFETLEAKNYPIANDNHILSETERHASGDKTDEYKVLQRKHVIDLAPSNFDGCLSGKPKDNDEFDSRLVQVF